MAVVTQTVFPSPVYVPYERPPQDVTLWSAIPRGLYSLVASEQLDAKPVNDDALLVITASLPANFAYVMLGMHFNLTQDRGQDWADRINLNFATFFRGDPVSLLANYLYGLVSGSRTNQLRTLVTSEQFTGAPTFPLLDRAGGPGVQFTMTAWNNADTVSSNGNLEFYISFWQFDLEQIRKHPINSPLPVQGR